MQPASYLAPALFADRKKRGCLNSSYVERRCFSLTGHRHSFPPLPVDSTKGFALMAVSERREERSRPNMWGIGVRQVVYMALGAALYGGLSYLTNILQLPATSNVSFRPAIVIPLFFGAVF